MKDWRNAQNVFWRIQTVTSKIIIENQLFLDKVAQQLLFKDVFTNLTV